MNTDDTNRKLKELSKVSVSSGSDLKIASKLSVQAIASIKPHVLPLPSKSFSTVLENRHSRRNFGPVNSNQIYTLLHHACRVRESFPAEDGYIRTSRPAASAGGRHAIDVFLLIKQVTGLDPGLWLYDPFASLLKMVNAPSKTHRDLQRKISELLCIEAAPPCCLLFVASVNRTLSRYENGFSLLWRDEGHISATCSLVAEALDLHTCPVGISSDFFELKCGGIMTDEPLWILGALGLGSSVG